MRVRLLGPVDVTVSGAIRPVPGLRRKVVLAVLALCYGEVVSTDRLADVVWGEAAPATALNTLQSNVSYLRGVLGDKSAILMRPPGYVLDAGAEGTDVRVAERLISEGMQAADPARGFQQLAGALALWRGRPLEDITGVAWLEEQATQLDQLWLRAKQALISTRLALGEHALLVAELEQLTAAHPFDEQFHAQLMLALYRAGRQADALAAYQRLRRTLCDDLGIDPGQSLRGLYAAILRQDQALGAPGRAIRLPAARPARKAAPGARVARSPSVASAPVPAQLPSAVPALAGRTGELRHLDAVLAAAWRGGPAQLAAAVICAVSGTAGVGKTTLAVHWARSVVTHFPDGQLYVNLRGFDPAGPAMDPSEALSGFLDAFGVPAEKLPPGLPAQTSLYRSVLAGRRVLVVLDNARDAAQVRPLLPGAPGSLAVVTSRNHLTPLVAAEGASPLHLGLLSPAEARDLLAHRLGSGRVAEEPDAVDDIITRCARLPLALAIAAARAATKPAFALAVLAAEMRAAPSVLSSLEAGDDTTDMRRVFSWSYRALGDAAARLFRLLSLHPGPDVTVPAAASLTGTQQATASDSVIELVRANLLTEHVPGRYGYHDLLRAFAAELTQSLDAGADRRAAVHRTLDHYLRTAYAAAPLLGFLINTPVLPPPADRVTLESLAGRDAAWAWFVAEQDVLLAAIGQASAGGYDVHTWQLAWTMDTFLKWRGRWHDQASVLRTAVDAARRLRHPEAVAEMLRELALAYTKLGLWDEAYARGKEALALFTEIGDPNLQALAHLQLGSIYDRQDRHSQAVRHAQAAVDLYREAGNHAGQAQALNSLGWGHACLGDYKQALAFCQQALPWLQETGDRDSEAGTWDSVGYAYHNLGDYRQAAASYQTALQLARMVGNNHLEAEILNHLGDTYDATSDHEAAHNAWRKSLAILDLLGHTNAEKVHAKLASAHTPLTVASDGSRGC
jgi:DNA-binding SARP family transcriptional activator